MRSVKELTVVIQNPKGLHARPAARFAATAGGFSSSVSVSLGDRAANGKSIMGLLTLAAAHNSTLVVRIAGPDEIDAANALLEVCAADLIPVDA